ncbi:hypothetical protein F5Y13DRAFT_187701 [Hypoxylon sp. FL1857]|nr:hypothetical protein F5Y13DRAFT_187701 [Hypoxylon sp. FL1857]
MSSPVETSVAASKAAGTGAKSTRGWSGEESMKLLFLIMQGENRDLGVKGWKELADKAQALFGGKYGPAAIKHQFQKLRLKYLEELPESLKNAATDENAAKAPGTSRKRAAPADDGSATKAKKARTSPKATDGVKNESSNSTDDDQPMSAKAVSKGRITKNSNGGRVSGAALADKPTPGGVESESTSDEI